MTDRGQPSRRLGVIQKLSYRLYLATMRFEALSLLAVRRRLFDTLLGRRHQRLNIFPHVYIEDIEGLSLGDDVSINRGCYLSCSGGVTIGDHVAIGQGSSVLSTEHGYADAAVPIKRQAIRGAPVRIERDVWIGAKATILAGVTIAEGTVVAAGAVVVRSIEERGTIVGGVPARRIKSRFD